MRSRRKAVRRNAIRSLKRKSKKAGKALKKPAKRYARARTGTARKTSRLDNGMPAYLRNVSRKEVSLPSVTTIESIEMLEKGEKPPTSKTGEKFKGKNRVIIS